MQEEDMKSASKFALYLSGDGKRLTTWTGGELAKVTSETTGRGGFGGSMTYVRAIAPDGSKWYGKNAGRGMCVLVHRAKS